MKPLSQQKEAIKHREKRARHRAEGKPSNNKLIDDVLSSDYIRRANHVITGETRFL